jgi:hypothetical protein
VDRRALRISAGTTAGRNLREVYFVVTPATGDLRRIEAGKGESAGEALTRAIRSAAAGGTSLPS